MDLFVPSIEPKKRSSSILLGLLLATLAGGIIVDRMRSAFELDVVLDMQTPQGDSHLIMPYDRDSQIVAASLVREI